MNIAVIADTHNLLRASLLKELESADVILHAGDICCASVVEQLRQIAPLHIVRGNNDSGSWAEPIPLTLNVELQGCRIHMLHDLKQLKQLGNYAENQVDLVICGHSHKPLNSTVQGVRVLNSGSCGPRRFSLPISMAWLSVTNGSPQIRFFELAE